MGKVAAKSKKVDAEGKVAAQLLGKGRSSTCWKKSLKTGKSSRRTEVDDERKKVGLLRKVAPKRKNDKGAAKVADVLRKFVDELEESSYELEKF